MRRGADVKPFLFGLFGIGMASALGGCTSVPPGALLACQDGIAEWAAEYQAVRVETVSTGFVQKIPSGGFVAPLHVRIVYARKGGYETREAEVNCTSSASGAIIAVI